MNAKLFYSKIFKSWQCVELKCIISCCV